MSANATSSNSGTIISSRASPPSSSISKLLRQAEAGMVFLRQADWFHVRAQENMFRFPLRERLRGLRIPDVVVKLDHAPVGARDPGLDGDLFVIARRMHVAAMRVHYSQPDAVD